MQVAANRAGLHAQPLGTVTSSEWLKYQWIHLATRPKPGQPSKFWANKGGYTFLERGVYRIASLLHRTRVNHLLTRLFDALGAGDSQVVLLRPN